MAHDHAHERDKNYYLEQICTIGICGALGGVAVMLYQRNMLWYILVEKFHLWVLIGGIALLALVVIRAVTLWLSLPPRETSSNHQHAPGEEHHHDTHHEHAHDCAEHDCGHEHGWNPWRFAVLLLPVVLYFLNLPNQGFSNVKGLNTDQVDMASNAETYGFAANVIGLGATYPGSSALAIMAALEGGNAKPMAMEFKELDQARFSPGLREFYQGKRAEVRGQFAPSGSPKVFTLVRYKMTCCGADAVPLNVLIVSPEEVLKQHNQWVKVVGKVHFAKRKDRDEYVSVLQIASAKDVTDVPKPMNPYIQ